MDAEDYFAFLESRFSASADQVVEIWISIRGYIARLIFADIVPNEVIRINLGYLRIPPAQRADETVYIWEDSLDELMAQSMIPEDQRYIHYHHTDAWYVLFPGVVGRLAARDNGSRQTFVCFERGTGLPESYVNKPFVNEMQWWLWDRYLLLHGAAVGIGGHGALITAPSGKGKSTLALACLVSGMDYVSEDYVLVSREGRAVGHPLLSTAYLTSATLEMLPSLRERSLFYVEWRDKHLIDLSSYGNQFVDEIALDAMIYPVVGNVNEPAILPARSVQPFIASLTTTAKQIKSGGNFTESFKALFGRMKTIPAYEMHLTPSPMENAAVLREFLLAQ